MHDDIWSEFDASPWVSGSYTNHLSESNKQQTILLLLLLLLLLL
jgi:hypothetical protein